MGDRKLKQARFLLAAIEESRNDASRAESCTMACVGAIRSVLKDVRSALERDGLLSTGPEGDAAWGQIAAQLRAGMPEEREKLGRWVERLPNEDVHRLRLDLELVDLMGFWPRDWGPRPSGGKRLHMTHRGVTSEIIDACRAGIEVAERTVERFKERLPKKS
jgi:hypothetical protein